MRARTRHRHIVPGRDAELKGALERRRQELLRQTQRRARHVRAPACDHRPGVDSECGTTDADLDDEIDLALPFAIRCKHREEAGEVSKQRQHHRSPHHVGSPLQPG